MGKMDYKTGKGEGLMITGFIMSLTGISNYVFYVFYSIDEFLIIGLAVAGIGGFMALTGYGKSRKESKQKEKTSLE